MRVSVPPVAVPGVGRVRDVSESISASAATAPPPDATLPPRHAEAPSPGAPIPSHYHRCFGCGVDHPTGLHLEMTAGAGLDVSARFEVTEHHQGAPGLAHGGVLTTAFDETMSALNWLIYRPAVTGRLEVDFRRPVPVGTVLHVQARVVGVARRKIYTTAEGRIGDPDGPIAVSAAAVFISVGLQHFEKFGRREDVEHAATRSEVMDTTVMFEVNP
jgi:acyl-coenzyme A thioesterase PaaI-like protein